MEEQREHFKLDWHRCNLKRKIEKKAPLSEVDFEKMLDDAGLLSSFFLSFLSFFGLGLLSLLLLLEVSSISGSDTEEEEERGERGEDDDNDDEDSSSAVFRGQSHFVEFQTASGEHVTLCKTLLLQNPRENVTVEEVLARVPAVFKGRKWSIFMCSGGHFAGVCFEGDKVVAHKTIHKYTVRRKQGGSQLAQDSSGKKAKSAGASIRRHNEMALQQEIRALLAEWTGHISASQFLFVQAPSFNRRIFHDYEETPFKKGDERLRKIPFSTRRPTLAEVKRLHTLLATVSFAPESIYQSLMEEAKQGKENYRHEKEQTWPNKLNTSVPSLCRNPEGKD